MSSRKAQGMARWVLASVALAVSARASAELVLYEHDEYRGRTFSSANDTANLAPLGFNDLASSVEVRSGSWQLCEDAEFRGQCIVLNAGRYPSLRAMGLNDRVSSLRRVGGGAGGDTAAIELYEHDDFAGRVYSASGATPNLQPEGFNDLASSLVIHGGRWELCSDAGYRGRCTTLEPGRHRRLRERDLNDVISSLRPVGTPSVPGVEAPGAPALERGMFNTWRAVFPDGCTVYYNAEGQRSTSEARCSAGQISQADDQMRRRAVR